MMNRKAFILILLPLFTVFPSCRKFTLVSPPSGHLTTDSVIANDSIAQDLMLSVYRPMMQLPSLFNGHATRHIGYYGAEFTRSTPAGQDSGFLQRRLWADNLVVGLAWHHCYDAINACNRVVALLAGSNGVSPATQTLLTSEAKFVRGLCYHYLVSLFGGCPIVTGTDYQQNRHVPRATDSAVYQLIVEDLQAAASQLPEQAPSGNSLPYPRVRPNKWAALALLSNVLLAQQAWAAAETAATEVINSGWYALEDSVQDVFQANSREIILQLQTPSAVSEESGFFAMPDGEPPVVRASKDLVARFEAGDRRLSQWLSPHPSGNATYYGITKYHQNKATLQYAVALRLGEQLLNRAEARLRQGKLAGATDDLNQIRSRALASPLPSGLPLPDLLNWLAGERERELFAEGGRHFFDLKRWFLTCAPGDPLFQAAQQNFSSPPMLSRWALWWPIPMDEIRLNPQLVQNDGYR